MTRPVVPAVFHLRRARDLIDRHFDEPLDLDAMARAAGLSRYHFARGFKEAFGETPGLCLARRRVERAQDLLRHANLTVTEIWEVDMITHLSHATVYVLDQDSARQFYTDKLGFEIRSDVSMGPVFDGGPEIRWLTVGPKAQPDIEIILAHCAMGHDEATAEQLRALVAKGVLGAGVMATDDCRATYEELSARGVVFLQEPAERPYGIEAVFRDDSGNWFSLTQRAASA